MPATVFIREGGEVGAVRFVAREAAPRAAVLRRAVLVFVDDFLAAVFRAPFALRLLAALRTPVRAAAFVRGRVALFAADLVFAA